MINIVNIDSLNFSFSNKRTIFSNSNLQIEKGDFVGIIGDNGCGKSTLLKLLLGLIKHNNTGIKINTNSIGYIPQCSNFNKDFPITVCEFLKYHCSEMKTSYSNALELIHKYNLQDCLNLLIGKLSGGQLQKLIVVRALLKPIDLLIVDEPTNNLDEKSIQNIYETLRDLNNQGITIIVVEHKFNILKQYTNKTFLIENGDIKSVSL